MDCYIGPTDKPKTDTLKHLLHSFFFFLTRRKCTVSDFKFLYFSVNILQSNFGVHCTLKVGEETVISLQPNNQAQFLPLLLEHSEHKVSHRKWNQKKKQMISEHSKLVELTPSHHVTKQNNRMSKLIGHFFFFIP